MNTQFVKPKMGLKVRDPMGGYLPDEGADVPISPYWNRRLKDGDVDVAKKPKPAKKEA